MKMKIFLLFAFVFFLSNIAFAENYKLEIVDYPPEVTIESGWMKYFSIIVSNTGESNLTNISINFIGEFPQWFEPEIKEKALLEPNNNATFLVKMNVPPNLETKVYSFTLNAKSKEASESKPLNVKVFKSKADMMLYDIQSLEIEIESIERNATRIESLGKNTTSVIIVLKEAKYYISEAKNYILIEDYEKVNSLMKNIENLIKEASFDLSIAPPIITEETVPQFQPEIIIMLSAPIIAIVLTFYFVIKRRKKEVQIKPTDKIKEGVLEKGENKLDNELKEIENSRNLLEEEFKDNLISKESYEELKEKYDKKIMELKAEAERNKKI